MSSGYFLIFHGSRDRRGQSILSQLIHLLSQKLALAGNKHWQQIRPQSRQKYQDNTQDFLVAHNEKLAILSKNNISLVGSGALELTTTPLHQQMKQYAESIHNCGYHNLKILPLFLAPGVHVCEDIPAEVAQFQHIFTPELNIELLPYLGHYPQILTILNKQFNQLPRGGRILLAHGTKYPQGNLVVSQLATQLNAQIAYYSVPHSLQAQVQTLMSQQLQRITIIPYFLFPGRTTDAIATEVDKLQQIYPEAELILGEPLSKTKELVELIFEVLVK